MKNLLLTLAAAALVAGSANAQKFQPMSTTVKLGKDLPTMAQFGKAPHQTQLNISSNVLRHSRANEVKRSNKEMSYQVTGLEAANGMLIPLGAAGITYEGLKNQYGIQGIGYAQAFTPDMLVRYKDNVITKINFAAWMGKYEGVKAVIIDPTVGQILAEYKVPSVQTITDSKNPAFPINSVDCDYQITGKEGALVIGWVAERVTPDPNDPLLKENGIIMPGYVDNTGSGQGAYMLFHNGKGYGLFDNFGSGWIDGNKNPLSVAAHITIETDGDGGLRDNDMAIAQVAPMRVDLKTGEGNQAVAVIGNLGASPISSFEYTIESAGKTLSDKVVLENPIYYYQALQVGIPAPLPEKGSRQETTITITKVNTTDDQFNEDQMNSATTMLVASDGKYKRTPVVEEFTSTGCMWCPNGIVGMEKLLETTKDVVAIAAHSNFNGVADVLSDNSYAAVAQAYGISGLPSSMVNREYKADPYSKMAVFANKVAGETFAESSMKITSTKPVSALNRTVKVTTTLDFLLDAPAGSYGLAYVLTEDGITGVDQLNGYAMQYLALKRNGFTDDMIFGALKWDETQQKLAREGKANTKGEVWYQPTFNHVACGINDPLGNTGASLLGEIKAGQTITHQAELPIPNRSGKPINRDNLKVAALLIDQATGLVVTGRQISLGEESAPSAIDQVTTGDVAEIEVAEGAFNVKAANAKAQVYTADGKLVSSCTVKGEASLPTFGKGVYVIRVEANGNVMTKKAVF